MGDFVGTAERLTQTPAYQNLSPSLQTALFLSLLALLPTALVTMTAYTRIVIVIGFVRRAVTQQDIPPSSVVVGLSLFLTAFVMGPTWDAIGTRAVTPYLDKAIPGPEAIRRTGAALHEFMLKNTRRQDLALFIYLARIDCPREPADTPLHVLVPAFVISELKTAFIMGFLIALPFLLIDLVVATVLTSMGMVMLPPVIISAPFKLLLFVIADGWHLLARALSLSFQ